MRDGSMVRCDGRLMRVLQTFHDFTRCVWIDGHGNIRSRWFESDRLMSIEAAYRPRSLWPEPGQLEALETEREEQAARTEAVAAKAAARKAKRSNKIRRTAA